MEQIILSSIQSNVGQHRPLCMISDDLLEYASWNNEFSVSFLKKMRIVGMNNAMLNKLKNELYYQQVGN